MRTSKDYVKATASRNVVAFASRLCYIQSVTNSGAYFCVRRPARTTAETLRRAVELLAHWDIPHLAVGGLAVQEHGYYRVTIDVDIVVPDVLEADEFLTADLTGPFERPPDDKAVCATGRMACYSIFCPRAECFNGDATFHFPLLKACRLYPASSRWSN